MPSCGRVEAEPNARLLWPLSLLTTQGKRQELTGTRGLYVRTEEWGIGSMNLYKCMYVNTAPVLLGEDLRCAFSYNTEGSTTHKHHRNLDRWHALADQESQAVPLSAFEKLILLYFSAESELIHSISALSAYTPSECARVHVDPLQSAYGVCWLSLPGLEIKPSSLIISFFFLVVPLYSNKFYSQEIQTEFNRTAKMESMDQVLHTATGPDYHFQARSSLLGCFSLSSSFSSPGTV